MADWRIGNKPAPCAFTPRNQYPWNNRFDDIQKEYRTIYFTESRLTCLREVLFDLRPDTKAISEYVEVFGKETAPEIDAFAGVVPKAWIERKVFVEVTAKKMEHFVALEAVSNLARIDRDLAPFHVLQGIDRVDISVLRGPNRPLTQRISRLFFDAGYPGIKFRSRHDSGACYAVFEGKSELTAKSNPFPLLHFKDDVMRVCDEWGLKPQL